MNYKRNWKKEEGLTSLFAKENSACRALEIDALRLSAGASYSFASEKKEYCITILSGTCSVKGSTFAFENIGKRMSVYEGKAYALYIPCDEDVTVTAVTELHAILAKCPSETHYDARLITPDDVVVKHLGKPGFEREAHFLVDERTPASKIYVGENFIRGGQWSSFPGHKHDVNDMPNEGFAEEIYYYQFDREGGYGIQQVYTADRSTDEAYAVREGDIVEIPLGYHPCCVAPGYTGYLLWMMACDNRGFFMTTDPEQKWQVQ